MIAGCKRSWCCCWVQTSKEGGSRWWCPRFNKAGHETQRRTSENRRRPWNLHGYRWWRGSEMPASSHSTIVSELFSFLEHRFLSGSWSSKLISIPIICIFTSKKVRVWGRDRVVADVWCAFGVRCMHIPCDCKINILDHFTVPSLLANSTFMKVCVN